MIRIHGSIQIPTTQVSQIKGRAVGLVRRYPLPTRSIKGLPYDLQAFQHRP